MREHGARLGPPAQRTSYLDPVVVQDGTNSLVYGLDLISSTDGAGSRRYFSYDGLGSTSDLSDAASALFQRHGARLYLDQVLAQRDLLRA